MAIPVLITVAALGAGFVALSRKRGAVTPPVDEQGNPLAIPTDAAQTVADQLGQGGGWFGSGDPVLDTGTGEGGISPDPDASTGADPSTTGGSGPESTGITLAGMAPKDPTLPPHDHNVGVALIGSHFGALDGVTTRQQSNTLAEMGPSLGLVW